LDAKSGEKVSSVSEVKKQVNKTVKHCEVCQENFGDRFSFCPVCGETLKSVEVGNNEAFAASGARNESLGREEKVAAAATGKLNEGAVFAHQEAASSNGSAQFQANQPDTFAAFDSQETVGETAAPQVHSHARDGLYHPTILQGSTRDSRLNFTSGVFFGLFMLMSIGTTYWVWELFNYPLDTSAIDAEERLYASLLADEPMEVVKEEPVRRNEDKGGGGGGGGKNDPKPVQEGIMPPMSRMKQEIAPDRERVVKPNFALKQQATLEGPPQPRDPRLDQYGVLNGGKDVSGGMGDGRGLGNGRGSGIGNGQGTGYGNGIGSGIGNGRGNGIGDGIGDGENRGAPPPPPAPKKADPPVVVSEPLKIIAQPRAGYTEEGRKNNVQGVVRLSVVLSASGQVTNITPVNSLPYGLTEKAIEAARQLQFVPAKKNGQPVSTKKVLEYRFTMY
jgi:TonB family protein